MSKHIIICLDGTWNDPTERTNVYKIFRALGGQEEAIADDDVAVGDYLIRKGQGFLAFYLEGVGAQGRGEGMLEGALGLGLHKRVLNGFLLASRFYEPGDKFWIFGFSRGAWSARCLAGMISKVGLLSRKNTDGWDGLLHAQKLWMQSKKREGENIGNAFWSRNDEQPIFLVGVWDTVGALGIPFFNGVHAIDHAEKHLFDFADCRLSDRVTYGLHAVAIDETRKDFEPTLWEKRKDGSIRQVWFTGVHADVGGGYRQTGLSDIALCWMADEANGLQSNLHFDVNCNDPHPAPDCLQDRHEECLSIVWKLRPQNPRQVSAQELVHPEVIRRMQQRDDYRPDSLKTVKAVSNFYDKESPRERVIGSEEHLPVKHLDVQESLDVDIFAQNCWNATVLQVKACEVYQIASSGTWKDKEHEASAAGYDSANFLHRSMESLRRVETSPWSCLVAAVHEDPGLESNNPNAGNIFTGVVEALIHPVSQIDAESQLVAVTGEGKLELQVQKNGFLYFFANDTPWSYCNNNGYLTVQILRRS